MEAGKALLLVVVLGVGLTLHYFSTVEAPSERARWRMMFSALGSVARKAYLTAAYAAVVVGLPLGVAVLVGFDALPTLRAVAGVAAVCLALSAAFSAVMVSLGLLGLYVDRCAAVWTEWRIQQPARGFFARIGYLEKLGGLVLLVPVAGIVASARDLGEWLRSK
jgi:hypothetical protein